MDVSPQMEYNKDNSDEIDPFNIDLLSRNDEESLVKLTEQLCQYVLENHDDDDAKMNAQEQSVVDVTYSTYEPLQKLIDRNTQDVFNTLNSQQNFSWQYSSKPSHVYQNDMQIVKVSPQTVVGTDQGVETNFNNSLKANYNIAYKSNTHIPASTSTLYQENMGIESELVSANHYNQPKCLQLITVQKNHLSGNVLILKNCTLLSSNNECNNSMENKLETSDNILEELIDPSVSVSSQSNNKLQYKPEMYTQKICDSQWGMFLDKRLNEKSTKQISGLNSEKIPKQAASMSHVNPIQSGAQSNGNIKIYGEFNVDYYIRQIYRKLSSRECYLCDYVGQCNYSLRTHMAYKHSSKIELQCEISSQDNQNQRSLIAPMKYRHYKNYHCSPCNFVTTHEETFVQQLRLEEENGDHTKRLVCGFLTNHKTSVVKHMQHVHRRSLPLFYCNNCEFSTRYAGSMKRHRSCVHKIMDAAVYECHKCEFKSCYKRELVQHARATHPESTPVYKCKQCTYTSHIRRSVKRHTINKHGGRMFQCRICLFETRRLEGLREHIMDKHDGNIRYTCKTCQFSTIYHLEMTNHMSTTHTSRRNALT